MTFRRRVRSLEKRSHRIHGKMTPQMICDARNRYLETGELPEDHTELAEMVVRLVEVAQAMWESVPGPPWENELVELLNDSERDDAAFDVALQELTRKYPEAADYLEEIGYRR